MAAGASTGPLAPPAAAAESVDIEGVSDDEEKRWQPVLALPCELSVDLDLPGFKVSDLLKLGLGTVLGSAWPVKRDVPLRVNGHVIGWSEFELVGENLAVRLTRLV
jgi:flagellar motor switch/type III secretory pathway protein FliN